MTRLTLLQMFLLDQDPVPEMPRQFIAAAVVDALNPAATKLDRVKALLLVAPHPLTTNSNQVALFDHLAGEDMPLAIDIIVDCYKHGAMVAHYLPSRIEHIDDPERLRRVVGVLAATARDDFDPVLLEEDNFFGLEIYRVVVAGMKRLLALHHAVSEVQILAKSIASSIRQTPSLQHVDRNCLDSLLVELNDLSAEPQRSLEDRLAKSGRRPSDPC
jgi:hypothetical protein